MSHAPHAPSHSTRSHSHAESTVGFDPFAAGTRSDLFELMQETAPFDAAAAAGITSARARESGRLKREASRRLRRASSERRARV